jgi:hypothetical protein
MSMVGLDKEIVSAFSRVRCNTSTCSGNVTGTTPIVAGSGTGAYRGDQRYLHHDRHDR